MSYRVSVNGTQIFGNNESYPEWNEFIKSQGIEIDEEGSYEGEIKDFMAMLQCVEKIVLRLEKERKERRSKLEEKIVLMTEEEKQIARSRTYGIKSIFDWTNIPDDLEKQNEDDKYNSSLFDKLTELLDNSYAFLPYTLYKACGDKLEKDKVFSTDSHFYCFKIKKGETIKVSAR